MATMTSSEYQRTTGTGKNIVIILLLMALVVVSVFSFLQWRELRGRRQMNQQRTAELLYDAVEGRKLESLSVLLESLGVSSPTQLAETVWKHAPEPKPDQTEFAGKIGELKFGMIGEAATRPND
jgi:hypothetical protein